MGGWEYALKLSLAQRNEAHLHNYTKCVSDEKGPDLIELSTMLRSQKHSDDISYART